MHHLSKLNVARTELIKIKQQYFLDLVSFFERKQLEIEYTPEGEERNSVLLLLEEVRTTYKKIEEEQELLFAKITKLKLVEKY